MTEIKYPGYPKIFIIVGDDRIEVNAKSFSREIAIHPKFYGNKDIYMQALKSDCFFMKLIYTGTIPDFSKIKKYHIEFHKNEFSGEVIYPCEFHEIIVRGEEIELIGLQFISLE